MTYLDILLGVKCSSSEICLFYMDSKAGNCEVDGKSKPSGVTNGKYTEQLDMYLLDVGVPRSD